MAYEFISFDLAAYRRFRRVYEKAVKEEKTEFEFEGREYLVSYAKYLLEYLETKYKTK